MSQVTKPEANEDSESDSNTSSRFSSFGGNGGGGCCCDESPSDFKTQATTTTSDDSAPTSSTSSSDLMTNGSELQQQQQPRPSSSLLVMTTGPTVLATRVTNETKESNNFNNKSDEVIQRSQQETGQKCDTTTKATASRMRHATGPYVARSGPGRPSSMVGVFQDRNQVKTSATSSHLHPSSSANRPTTASFSDIRQASLTSSSTSPRVSPVAISSLNISSPLDRLSECDAITRRLMSSPIRTVNLAEKPMRRSQASCESRRASLGTKSITEQVSQFTANQFNSLEFSYAKSLEASLRRDQRHRDDAQSFSGGGGGYGGGDKQHHQSLQSKQQQQLTVRSLSVCQEDSLKLRCRNYIYNLSSPLNHHHHQPHHHSSNLNRAVSLACESSPGSTATITKSKRLLTIIPLFGCDMKALEQYMRSDLILPPPIDSVINHILSHGIDAIGIFRKSGVKSRILNLKQRIENNQDARVDEINVENEFSIYDIADLVKMWFRELKPTPILTSDLIRRLTVFLETFREDEEEDVQGKRSERQHRNSSQISGPSIIDELMFTQRAGARPRGGDRLMMRQIISTISPAHRVLISRAMSFFATISSKSEINQMTSQNLAICLTPSLCATETDQASILLAQRALKYCIDNYEVWQDDPSCN